MGDFTQKWRKHCNFSKTTQFHVRFFNINSKSTRTKFLQVKQNMLRQYLRRKKLKKKYFSKFGEKK